MLRALALAGRYWANLRRPSPAANEQRLRERGESVDSLVIRDAIAADIPKLAELHVKTWNATYAPFAMKGPSVALRAMQWRDFFETNDPRSFVIVVERADGALVGFARGIRKDGADGELNKIYLLGEYQRLGLGTRLFSEVARRLAALGATHMSAYTDARNPSGWFFEKLGGSWRKEADGRINTEWYHWQI
jgi:GNAT superfamily N-acetyltransferase